MNYFLKLILDQVLSYIRAHPQEIIDLLLSLLPGGLLSHAGTNKMQVFKLAPTEANLLEAVEQVVAQGVDAKTIANALIAKVASGCP